MENPDRVLFNRAKAKLLSGEQVFSHTVSSYNPEAYCAAAANADFTWFEMQHSTMTFDEVRLMIAACPRVGAAPIIRIPEAQEGFVQKAMDLGALGVIVPTVDNFIQARAASRWVRFPPVDRRSSGGGQAQGIWSEAIPEGQGNFRENINDNMLVIVMIETLEGVSNALEIASQPGVDVVILGNADMSSFSGFSQNSPEYHDLQIRIRNATYQAGKFWGNAGAGNAVGNPLSPDSRLHQNAAPGAGRGGAGGGRGGGAGGRGGGAGPGAGAPGAGGQ
jgi:2-keto-3-deoxy-L-rhamnonate aldolase RhmA